MKKEPKQSYNSRWLTLSMIQGHIAMWSVRQSPYNCLEGLADVLKEFHGKVFFRFDLNHMAQMNRAELTAMLKECFLSIHQVQLWNERKNGNKSLFQFVSRYDGPKNPDDDFIDLDALTGNIVRSVFVELDQDCESDRAFEREWKMGWIKRMWVKLFPSRVDSPCEPKNL